MNGLKDWQLKFLRRWIDHRSSACAEITSDNKNLQFWYDGKADAFQEISDVLDCLLKGNEDE